MSAEIDERDRQHRAKRYEAIHNGIFVVETVYTILLLLAFLFWEGSDSLADFARSKSSNPWIYVAIYGAVLAVATKLLFLPLNFFGDYYLEHRFGLSNETFGAWAFDELKTHLRGANIILRSKTPDLVRQEFYGLMMAHFAIRGLMHEAALKADKDPDRLSFLHAVRVIRRKLPAFVAIPPSAQACVS